MDLKMIPQSVQKMIEEEAEKRVSDFTESSSIPYYERCAFKEGASFSYELGFGQGIEAVCEWLTHEGEFAVRNHCPANLKLAIESHFKESGAPSALFYFGDFVKPNLEGVLKKTKY